MSAKYFVHSYNRVQSFRYGLKKKSSSVSSSFAYCYLEKGVASNDKPSLLLIHGFGNDKYSFLSLFGEFPRDQHVIVLDLPGHGETPAKEDVSVMEFVRSIHEFVGLVDLDKKKFHLLGTSMGGQIAGVYAKEYPDQLTSVILLSPIGVYFEGQEEFIRKAMAGEKMVLMPETFDEMKAMLDHVMYNKPKIPDMAISGMLQMRLENMDNFKKLIFSMGDPENANLLEKHLSDIHTPMLLIWGKEDKVSPVECVDTILKKITTPPKKVLIMDDTGHGIVYERPNELNKALVEFFVSL